MIETVKFTRNPQFTPASLSGEQLDAIEGIARQVVSAMRELGHEAQKFDDLNLGGYLNPAFCQRFGVDLPAYVVDDDAAWTYLRNSINYAIAICGRKGWLKSYSRTTSNRQTWATIRGY